MQQAQQAPQVEVISLPPLLTKTDLKKFLDIGDTKASELLNRPDFPVCRELGHPRVPTALLMRWIEQHTEWTGANAGDGWPGNRRHGVA
nr:hypothetical protein [Paenibacillus sinopodophylli]